MKCFKTVLNVAACLPVLICWDANAGWDVSGSQQEVHQRVVHRPRMHVAAHHEQAMPAPKKVVHYRRANTYKDYLSVDDRAAVESDAIQKERAPLATSYPKPVPERSVQTTRRPTEYGGLYAITINGSLKDNLTRVMSRYQWRVAWNAPYDYNFDGRVTGTSLPNVIEKLIKPFPLRAVMYMSNRTLAVVPKERMS